VSVEKTTVVTDGDGDTATDSAEVNITSSIVIEDDGPNARSSAVDGTPPNTTPDPTPSTVYLTIPEVISQQTYTRPIVEWTYGADGKGSITLSSQTAGYGFSPAGSASAVPTIAADGSVTFDVYRSYVVNDVTTWEMFATYTLRPGADDTLVIKPYTGATSITTLIDGSGATAGQPVTSVSLNLVSAGTTVVVTGEDGNKAGKINASSQGWAIGNQNLDPAELINFSFYNLNSTTLKSASDFGFVMDKYTSSGTVQATLTVQYDTGTAIYVLNNVTAGSYVFIDKTGVKVYSSVDTSIPPYIVIAESAPGVPLTFTSVSIANTAIGGVSWNVNGPSVTVPVSTTTIPDLDFSFNFVVYDGDGDSSAVLVNTMVDGSDPNSLSLNVLSEKPSVTPVALDLDADSSISYLDRDSGVSFDYGTGLMSTAWVGSQDGLLVYDYNDDGLIAEAKELVFAMWGDNPDVITDMQALAAYFDSNKDGVFDAIDEAWSSFGVWQDLNTDGVQQEGEFYDLAHWGIESIALSYDADSQAYSAADGDVQVFGQMTVSYADGTTGLAEDMGFAVQSAVTTAEAPLASTSEPAYPVDALVTSYLESMAVAGDTDSNGELSAAELAYGLDDMVSQFIDAHGFSIDDYAAIQQEVYNELAHELNDLSIDDGIDIAFDATGDANGAEVLAALDDHFMDIYDAHITPAESYDDSGSMMV
jgi:hypothetical protein